MVHHVLRVAVVLWSELLQFLGLKDIVPDERGLVWGYKIGRLNSNSYIFGLNIARLELPTEKLFNLISVYEETEDMWFGFVTQEFNVFGRMVATYRGAWKVPQDLVRQYRIDKLKDPINNQVLDIHGQLYFGDHTDPVRNSSPNRRYWCAVIVRV